MVAVSDLEVLRQLAALQALYKHLGKVLSTKDPHSLRGTVDYRLRELYEQAGIDRISIMVDGDEVGKLTVKKREATTETVLLVDDVDDLVSENGEMVEAFLRENAKRFAEYIFETTGSVPEGCKVTVMNVPGGYDGTVLTGCKPEVVLPMLGVGQVVGYLEG